VGEIKSFTAHQASNVFINLMGGNGTVFNLSSLIKIGLSSRLKKIENRMTMKSITMKKKG